MSRPLRGGSGNEKRTFLVDLGSSMISIFSSCLIRLWTWVALVAL